MFKAPESNGSRQPLRFPEKARNRADNEENWPAKNPCLAYSVFHKDQN